LQCLAEYARIATMTTFNDFCKWAGSQRRAASMLGVSEASVSRWASAGRIPTVEAARKVEAVTHGLFKWADMLVPGDSEHPTHT
jgi:DNA-binding transcriptional regulator YdaS (Cro superfamily)